MKIVEKFKAKIENPESSIEFLMKLRKSNKNLTDINDISKYVDEAIKEIINTDDAILVELTLKKMSTEFDIQYDTLKNKYDNLIKEKNKIQLKKPEEIHIKQKYNKYDSASRSLIYYMIRDRQIINLVENKITYFPDESIRILSNEIIYFYQQKTILL